MRDPLEERKGRRESALCALARLRAGDVLDDADWADLDAAPVEMAEEIRGAVRWAAEHGDREVA